LLIIFANSNVIEDKHFVKWLCLSVYLSVCLSHASIVPKPLNILKHLSPLGSHTILLFRTKRSGNIPTGAPKRGRQMHGYELSRFSTDISLYLENNARKGHSYYTLPIGNRTKISRLSVTLSDLE